MLIDLELTSHGLMIILRKWHTTQPELDIMTSPIRSIILSFEPLASIEALRL
jgi:Holliday junction resolvase-like predicted endonuclease